MGCNVSPRVGCGISGYSFHSLLGKEFDEIHRPSQLVWHGLKELVIVRVESLEGWDVNMRDRATINIVGSVLCASVLVVWCPGSEESVSIDVGP